MPQNEEIDMRLVDVDALQTALVFVLEGLIAGAFPLREIVAMFFIANEGLPILENAADAGIPLSPKLKDVLGQLKGGEQVK